MSESGIADDKDEKKTRNLAIFGFSGRLLTLKSTCLVPRPRLELGRLAAADFESAASTDSAIGATLCPATCRLLPGA